MFFKDLILSNPDVTQKQWAAWLQQSDGAIRHYAKGEGSPDIDRCVRAFPFLPTNLQDAFLGLFARSSTEPGDPLALAMEASSLVGNLACQLAQYRDSRSDIRPERLLALGEAAKRTIDHALRASRIGRRK